MSKVQGGMSKVQGGMLETKEGMSKVPRGMSKVQGGYVKLKILASFHLLYEQIFKWVCVCSQNWRGYVGLALGSGRGKPPLDPPNLHL